MQQNCANLFQLVMLHRIMAQRSADAFLEAATKADRPIRTLCSVLYYTDCRDIGGLGPDPPPY